MKKYILTLAVLILGITQATAQNLYVDEVVEVPQGGQAKVAIRYETGGYAIKGFGIAFTLPEGLSTVKNAAGKPAYQVLPEYTGDDNVNKFDMASANDGWSGTCTDGQLQGESGIIFYALLAADESLALNSTHTVQVTKVMVTRVEDGVNKSYYLPDFTFTVKIVENITILDEESTTAPEAAENVKVQVLRTIKAGNWSTLCLPFAMSEAQVITAFGDDVQIADFTGCEPEYASDEDEYAQSIKVKFTSVTSIEANHPYLIKVSNGIQHDEGFKVDGVTIVPEDDPCIAKDEVKQKVGNKWFYFYNSFFGTYVAGTEIPAGSIILSGNKFYLTKGTSTKGFRGWFYFDNCSIQDMETALAEGSVKMFIGDNSTAIEKVDIESNTEGIFDMSGRKLISQPKTKGVYIINGKKIAVK